MAGNVVNLNKFRKQKARADKAKQAEINRVRHGRTKAQREREHTDRERAARLLEGKRLEQAAEIATESDARSDDDAGATHAEESEESTPG